MIGFPWEDEDSINKTLSFIESLNTRVLLSLPKPYPGPKFFDNILKLGGTINSWNSTYNNTDSFDYEPSYNIPSCNIVGRLMKFKEIIDKICKRR